LKKMGCNIPWEVKLNYLHSKIKSSIQKKLILGKRDIIKHVNMCFQIKRLRFIVIRGMGVGEKLQNNQDRIKQLEKQLLHQSVLINRLSDLLEQEIHRPPERGGSEYERLKLDFTKYQN